MKRIAILALGAVLLGSPLGAAEPARCGVCAGKMFVTNIGACGECGARTPSGSFALCPSCAARLGQCQACRGPLSGGGPAANEPADTPMKVPADTPAENNTFTFVVYGDTRTGLADHRRVMAEILKEDPDFVCHTGDAIATGGKQKEWGEFREIVKPLLDREILYQCIGNHEIKGKDDSWRQFLRETYPYLPEQEQLYYSLVRGNALFLFLDNTEASEQEKDGNQYAFAEKALAETDAAWKFVILHAPPVSSGGHGASPKMAEFIALFETYGVDVVFSGHNHFYQRSKPILKGAVDPAGITYVVTGGGGAPFYEIEHDPEMYECSRGRAFHFCLLVLSGEGLMMTVRSDTGEVIDTFTKDRPAGEAETLRPAA